MVPRGPPAFAARPDGRAKPGGPWGPRGWSKSWSNAAKIVVRINGVRGKIVVKSLKIVVNSFGNRREIVRKSSENRQKINVNIAGDV